MKNVKLKKMTPEEFKTKKIMIEASGLFDENAIKLLEVGIQRDLNVVLNEKQSEMLVAINLTEEIEEEVSVVQENATQTKDKYVKKEEILYETNSEKEEIPHETDSEKEEIVENDEIFVSEDIQEVDAEIEIRSEEEKVEEISEEQRLEEQEEDTVEKVEEKQEEKQEFIPDSVEEIEDLPQEVIEKMYYLSGERMIETLKRMNNGNTWKVLGVAGNDNELQVAIEKAYRSVIYPNDLTDLDFLDKRVGEYLPDSNQAMQLRELHKAALFGTYVGYHVEQNEAELGDVNENQNIAIVKFPLLASELPDTLKNQAKSDLKKAITRSVEDIMNIPDSYKALMILIPIEETIDKSMHRYAEGLHDTEENKAVKAYIKTIRADMNNEIKNGMDDLNVSLDLYGINWEDKNTRKSVIAMLETLQGEGRETEVTKFVEEVNMSFDVNSPEDISAVDKACNDLSKLSSQGIKVNIAFDLPPKEGMNPELQSALDEVVDKYENIERDTSQEAVDNGVNALISEGVEKSVEPPTISKSLDLEATSAEMTKNAIMAVSLGATALDGIEQEIEEFLERQRNIPNESDGE